MLFRSNQELKTFSPLLTLNKHLTKIALNEGLKSLNLTTFDPPNVHHLTFPSTLEEVSGGPLHISRLYSLTIEEGCSAKIPENLFAYDYCRTLVAVFDHRGKAEKEYALPSGVRFTEENEADFRLIKDGDYVLYPINEEYCLLDYDGWDIAIDVPEAFHDGEKEISSYFVTSRFFLSHAINYRMEDDMEAWKSFNEPYASSITFHLSATRFEVDVDHKLYSYLRNLYFDMGKQEAEERLNPLLPLTSLFPLAAYYKDSPTGEYAPFYEYSPNL